MMDSDSATALVDCAAIDEALHDGQDGQSADACKDIEHDWVESARGTNEVCQTSSVAMDGLEVNSKDLVMADSDIVATGREHPSVGENVSPTSSGGHVEHTHLPREEQELGSVDAEDPACKLFNSFPGESLMEDKERLSTPLRQQQLYASGYRPSSSEIAAQIDGFFDDFEGVSPCSLGEVPEEDGNVASPVESARNTAGWATGGEAAEASSTDPNSVLYQLQASNAALQRKWRQVVEQRHAPQAAAAAAAAASSGGTSLEASRGQAAEARYHASLLSWHQLVQEHDSVVQHYAEQAADLQAGLLEANTEADTMRATFLKFVTQIAKSAVNERTNQLVGSKAVEAWLAKAEQRETELRGVRARCIRLQQSLKKVQQSAAKTEKLANGLHLIDFEQLKIENQTLNEKIEERNLEILALRKKTAQTVAELTHVKEKLHFQEKVTQQLQERMDEVEGALAAKRDELNHLKNARDKEVVGARHAQQTACTITNPLLLQNLREAMEMREDLRSEVAELESRHATMVASTAQTKARAAAVANAHTLRTFSSRQFVSQSSVIGPRPQGQARHMDSATAAPTAAAAPAA